MIKHIGITGAAGAGKDTVADLLVELYGYQKASMAGPLKAGLAAMGFPEPANRADKEKTIPGFDFTWRHAAQMLGTEFGRGLDPELWIKVMRQRLLKNGETRIVISDIRFDNEAEMIRSLGGKVIHLAGRRAELGAAAAHASEAGVTVFPSVDGMIDNSGLLTDTLAQIEHYLGLRK